MKHYDNIEPTLPSKMKHKHTAKGNTDGII